MCELVRRNGIDTIRNARRGTFHLSFFPFNSFFFAQQNPPWNDKERGWLAGCIHMPMEEGGKEGEISMMANSGKMKAHAQFHFKMIPLLSPIEGSRGL